MEPITREFYWNVQYARLLIYPFFVVMLAVLGYGLYGRYRLWRLGQAAEQTDRRDDLGGRLSAMLVRIFSQVDLLRVRFPGTAHFLIFWGFVLLTIGTTLIFIQEDISAPLAGIRFIQGNFYLLFSLVLDLAGLAAIVAVLLFAYRRYLVKASAVENKGEDLFILGFFLVILVGGFVVEALRLAATGMPAFEVWSPVGWVLAQLLRGVDHDTLLTLHGWLWWAHMLLAFGFLAYIGYSKLLHILTAPLNITLRSRQPAGALLPIPNLEEAETYGASRTEDFTWKQLLDGDACMRCGRCQDNCPAWNTQKPLSPRKIVRDVRDEMNGKNPIVSAQAGGKQPGKEMAETPRAALIGGRIKEEELWACTTCRACQEHCPVNIEHIGKIVDMRRYLVLSESRFPAELNGPFRSLEMNGCPWEIAPSARADWAQGLGIRTLAEAGQAEYLWWVGCAVSVDERNKKVAMALARVLKAGEVDFAMLGTEERCCGDPGRRTGNEYLFQMLATANVEVLNSHNVRKILVHCPHCYNTLKNEYPQFQGNYEVIHTSELLADLLRQGRLKVNKASDEKLAYHDPCYLGRHNGIYDEPRRVLASAGAKLAKMRRSRASSFCCGGGGGRMWMEERLGRRINQMRVDHLLATGAGTVAVSCPYCLSMLTNGVADKGLTGQLNVVDYVEVLAKTLD